MDAKQIHDNPSPDELRKFTEQMATARVTEFENVNVQTRVTSRSTSSTFIVTDDPDLTDIDRLAVRYTGQPFRRRDAKRVSAWFEPERWHGWSDAGPWG
jgi:ATP-dependent phosphoenolpyruvate carboxykinase